MNAIKDEFRILNQLQNGKEVYLRGRFAHIDFDEPDNERNPYYEIYKYYSKLCNVRGGRMQRRNYEVCLSSPETGEHDVTHCNILKDNMEIITKEEAMRYLTLEDIS